MRSAVPILLLLGCAACASGEVALDDGSIAYLSGLEPTAVDGGRPFGDDLGMHWPPRMDRCVHRGLRLAEVVDGHAILNRDAISLQQFLGLEFMNLHSVPS